MFNNKDPDNTSHFNNAKNSIQKIWGFLPWNRLKKEQESFYKLAVEHGEQKSPQAVQGMWQAYGQMRASKISGFFTIFSLGIAGVSLNFYQKYLSRQKKELISKENELVTKEQEINEYAENSADIYLSYQTTFYQLELANKRIKELCPNEECYKEYESNKEIVKDNVIQKSKSVLLDSQFFNAKNNDKSLTNNKNVIINKNITKGL